MKVMVDIDERMLRYLRCHGCGKVVSTAFLPVNGNDGQIVIRAWIECPECIGKKAEK